MNGIIEGNELWRDADFIQFTLFLKASRLRRLPSYCGFYVTSS
ncbi:hypothetical protein ES319_D02G175100v1 [Gossypium barbadense]|uniref:Uncharacterized protein n=1 Tax=Gossypium barbadense TaxID=3634 RepID=A0A5J5SG32_GOSBA|nr:hypothetical protein ES319_D02G175100v1 [Gossypium barbadense]